MAIITVTNQPAVVVKKPGMMAKIRTKHSFFYVSKASIVYSRSKWLKLIGPWVILQKNVNYWILNYESKKAIFTNILYGRDQIIVQFKPYDIWKNIFFIFFLGWSTQKAFRKNL